MVSATTPMAGTAVTSVRSLNETVSSLVVDVDRLQHRAVERGQRLHRRAGHEQATGRHPALDAAGAVGVAAVLARRVVPADGIVGLRAPAPGHVEALAQLDALDRLDAHERLREQAVELAVPVHVAAEARRARRRRAPRRRRRASRPPWPPPRPRRPSPPRRRRRSSAPVTRRRASRSARRRSRCAPCSPPARAGPRARRPRHRQPRQAAPWRTCRRRRAPPSPAPRPARARRGRRRSRTSACPARSAWPGPRLGQRAFGLAGCGRHLLLPLRPLGVGDLDRDRRRPACDRGGRRPTSVTSSCSKRMRGPAPEPEPAPRRARPARPRRSPAGPPADPRR